MRELTRKEIQRQDFVDNAIFELMNELISNKKTIDWDIEMIAGVREEIRIALEKRGIMEEREFYPYLEIVPCQKYES